MKIFINFSMCCISLLLFFNAPSVYSYEYCLSLFLFFVLFALIYCFIEFKNRTLGFEFLFLISFFMTNFVYPIFYYIDNRYVSLFQFGFNENVITKSTSIALVAFTFFILGNTNYRSKGKIDNKLIVNETLVLILFFLSLVSFIIFSASGGLDVYRNLYSNSEVNYGYANYFIIIFTIFTTMLAVSASYLRKSIYKFPVLVYILFLIFIFLSTGARLFAVSMVLIYIVQYSQLIRRIPMHQVLLVIFFGAIFLHFIQIFREIGIDNDIANVVSQMDQKKSFFDPFMDLIINNRNLYVLVDFVDTNGYLYFVNASASFFGIFPSISFFLDLFNIPIFITGGVLPTYLQFGLGGNFGLGTNMVGEAYLSLGIIGVVVVFWSFGSIIKFIGNNVNKNLYFALVYFYLVSQSVFYPRIDYLWGLRTIVWMLLALYIINKIIKRKGLS